jgi:ABC-type Fe3+ transport system permease subunit
VLAPDNKALDRLSRTVMFALLLTWYFTSGRAQASLVKARFGTQYPRRGWAKPLALAVGVVVFFICAMVVVGLAMGAFRGEV